MTREEIERRLAEIVRREKNLPDEVLAPGTTFEEAGIDSLDALTILFAVEEEFRISVPDAKARAMKTFGDIVGAVVEQVAAREQSDS